MCVVARDERKQHSADRRDSNGATIGSSDSPWSLRLLGSVSSSPRGEQQGRSESSPITDTAAERGGGEGGINVSFPVACRLQMDTPNCSSNASHSAHTAGRASGADSRDADKLGPTSSMVAVSSLPAGDNAAGVGPLPPEPCRVGVGGNGIFPSSSRTGGVADADIDDKKRGASQTPESGCSTSTTGNPDDGHHAAVCKKVHGDDDGEEKEEPLASDVPIDAPGINTPGDHSAGLDALTPNVARTGQSKKRDSFPNNVSYAGGTAVSRTQSCGRRVVLYSSPSETVVGDAGVGAGGDGDGDGDNGAGQGYPLPAVEQPDCNGAVGSAGNSRRCREHEGDIENVRKEEETEDPLHRQRASVHQSTAAIVSGGLIGGRMAAATNDLSSEGTLDGGMTRRRYSRILRST